MSFETLFSKQKDQTKYSLLTTSFVESVQFDGKNFLKVDPAALELLAARAFDDVSHLLRRRHLEQLSKIINDPESSLNDRYVASELIENAVIASERVFPSCQDTGTAIVIGKKGEHVLTGVDDTQPLSAGIYRTYQDKNLRYSQLAPLSLFEEKNTGNNLPAQIEIYSVKSDEYNFLFIAKGGGSANKTFLYQMTKSLLNPSSLETFVREAVEKLGTAACPPYHLALVIGGLSAEQTLKTVKLASCGELDDLPTSGSLGGRAFRDLEAEKLVETWARESGIGAQFGGKYFVHDVRVIRLPRHGASCPVGLGVSCSADRQIKGKITKDGVFIEELEKNPQQFLPKKNNAGTDNPVAINLNRPMAEICQELSKYPISTRIMLSGCLIVARDIAHAKLAEMIEQGKTLPDYVLKYPIYYAGPAKTPEGFASGSFGPTTSQRMDPYVPIFQSLGGSLIMLGKGNRTSIVTESCKKFGGFYLGSIGGPAAKLGRDCITKVDVLDFSELGMEAVWKIEVENFPAFIIVDDKGNDFFDTKKRKETIQIGRVGNHA
jgi:fumarate hydratase, class I